jgi:uncharacterized protein (DUF58 family)
MVFFGLLSAILMAGFNSGNNLLYLIAGVMITAALVSFVAGRLNLSKIGVTRRLPPYVFAGSPVRIGLDISNKKRLLHSFGVKLDGIAEGVKDIFLLVVERQGRRSEDIGATFPHRGLHTLPPLLLSTRFPWGLFEHRRKLSDKQELLVYPRIFELDGAVAGPGHIRDEFPQHTKGYGSGLYGIREYRHGEDSARICWKLSAKLDRLMVRETESEERRRACIVFDNALRDRSTVTLAAFERAVSAAASLVWRLCRSGCSVKLIMRDRVVGYGEGHEAMHRMLIALALVEPAPPDGNGMILDKRIFEGGTVVVVSCKNGIPEIRSLTGEFSLSLSEGTGGAE